MAVITGAAGGSGRRLCRRLCEEGAHVAALDVNQAALDELQAALKVD